MEKQKDPIGRILKETRKSRNVSVPQLADILSIPHDRIYKWEKGATPKYEDRLLLENWITNPNFQLESSKIEEISKGQLGKNEEEAIWQRLLAEKEARRAETAARLERMDQLYDRLMDLLETNLGSIQETAGVTLAYQKAWVEKVARQESGGDPEKKETVLQEWDTILSGLVQDDENTNMNDEDI